MLLFAVGRRRGKAGVGWIGCDLVRALLLWVESLIIFYSDVCACDFDSPFPSSPSPLPVTICLVLLSASLLSPLLLYFLLLSVAYTLRLPYT